MPLTGLEVVYEYVEEVDQNLICSICRSALVDPVTTTSCKHTFCRDCIHQSIRHDPRCPIDRSALSFNSLQDTETLVQLILDELIVKCTTEGCGEVMQRGLLLSHSRTCQRRIVLCGEGGCGLSMKREDLPQHRAYECFRRQMECDACGVLLTFLSADWHSHNSRREEEALENSSKCGTCGDTITSKQQHIWLCPQAKVPCTHAQYGCSSIVHRSELESHLQTCIFDKLLPLLKRDNDRFAFLNAKIHELEIKSATLEHELRRAAFHLQMLSCYANNVELGMGTRSRLVEQDLRTDNNGGATTGVGQPESTRATAVETESRPSGPRLFRSMQNMQNQPQPENRGPFGPPNHRPAIPRMNARVDIWRPELNLETIPGESPRSRLDRLRQFPPTHRLGLSPEEREQRTARDNTRDMMEAMSEETNRLAVGMDSMERWNHVSRVTDGLRLSEEVESLRAIVNTLRLEVMRDRPMSTVQNTPERPSHSQRQAPAPSLNADTSDVPFAAYVDPHHLATTPSSPDGQQISLDSEEDNANADHERGSVRESVLFRTSTRNSTTSLVSTVSSTATAQGRPRRRARQGRPMGIPPPTDEEEPSFAPTMPSTVSATGTATGSSRVGIHQSVDTDGGVGEGSTGRSGSRLGLQNPIARLKRLRDAR